MGTHTSLLPNPALPSKHLPSKSSDKGIPSASGAYNGTGIATLEPRGVDVTYHLFYQDYDGWIKNLTSTDPRTPSWVESPDPVACRPMDGTERLYTAPRPLMKSICLLRQYFASTARNTTFKH